MPAPKILPGDIELRHLVQRGWTYREIAEFYGVTESAVYLRLRNAGLTRKNISHLKNLPWKVEARHRFAYPMQMLRILGQLRAGRELSEPKRRMLDRWLEGMRQHNVVLCYDPDMPPNPASKPGGFYYSRRRPEDGDSIWRAGSAAEATNH